MLTHWNRLLNTDCKVIEKDGIFIYPIFKNGSSSLFREADRVLVNDEVATCDNIKVLIRHPAERFVSGLNEYCEQNGLVVQDTYELVRHNKLSDRHFAPQWIWLLHLAKHYRGTITLEDFSEIGKYCTAHQNKRTRDNTAVEPLHEYTHQDMLLMEHVTQNLNIETLIRICKYGLSKT